ncbi:hypothetical protein [Cyclobacterium roseum]|nr:hypothetical protein [Cyclobacterium roseum]
MSTNQLLSAGDIHGFGHGSSDFWFVIPEKDNVYAIKNFVDRNLFY